MLVERFAVLIRYVEDVFGEKNWPRSFWQSAGSEAIQPSAQEFRDCDMGYSRPTGDLTYQAAPSRSPMPMSQQEF